MHGEPPEVAVHPGSAKKPQNAVLMGGAKPAEEVQVLLSDSLAQGQVTQVSPLEVVLPLAEEVSFPLALRLQPQTLAEVGLDAAQLKQR